MDRIQCYAGRVVGHLCGLLLALLVSTLFYSVADAQCGAGEVAYVKVGLEYSTGNGLPNDGNLAEGVGTLLFDSDGFYIGEGEIGATGEVDIYEWEGNCIPYGSYRVEFWTDSSPFADLAGLYGFGEVEFVIDSGLGEQFDGTEYYYDSNLGVNFGAAFELLPASRYLAVSVYGVDETGLAVSGSEKVGELVEVEVYSDFVYQYSAFALTSGRAGYEGIAYVPIPTGDGVTVDVYAAGDAQHDITPQAAGETALDLPYQVIAEGTEVQFFFKDENGAAFAPTDQQFVEVVCENVTEIGELQYFYTLVYPDSTNPSQTTGYMLPQGDFDCFVSLYDEYFNEEAGATEIVELAFHSFPIEVTETFPGRDVFLFNGGGGTGDASVEIRVTNRATGQLLNDQCTALYLWAFHVDENGDFFFYEDEAEIPEGQEVSHTFQVPSGLEYELFVGQCFPDEFSSVAPSKYVFPFEPIILNPVSGTNDPVTFEMTPTDAVIRVVLQDENGNPLSGWADVYSGPDFDNLPFDKTRKNMRVRYAKRTRTLTPQDPEFFHYNGGDVVGGVLEIGAIGGRSYLVNAFPGFEAEQEFIPAPEQEVTLVAGETKTVTFTVRRPNHIIQIEPVLPAGVTLGEFGFLDCFAFNRDGQTSYGFGTAFEKVRIPIFTEKKGKNIKDYWRIGCNTVVFDESGRDFYYFGTTLYSPEGTEGTATLTLSKDQEFSGEQCKEFRNDKKTRVTFADGVTFLEVPKGAFGTSGSTTICAESGDGYGFAYDNFPTSVWDITVTQGDKNITTAKKPVQLWIPIDSEELSNLGATKDDLAGGSFNAKAKNWRRDAAITFSELNGVSYMVLSLQHFSLWGSLVNLSESEQKSAPTTLSEKGKKGKKVTLSWTPPDNADEDTPFFLQWVKVNKKTKAFEAGGNDIFEYPKAKSQTIVGQSSVKLKLKNGRWRWRVRVKGGATPAAGEFKRKKRRRKN
jgi:hypothetical protein